MIRIVEGQHLISANRLAATSADQALLEALADQVKPPLPEAARHLPWLLASPFRYGLGRPSRFRAPDILPGLFHASEDLATAVCEAAHWRLVAFSRSPDFLRLRTPTPMSAFSVLVDAKTALDLTVGELAREADRWTHPSDYSATQQLAAEARTIGVEALRAPSARRKAGINVAVLEPAALVPPASPHSSWAFLTREDGLIATQEMGGMAMRFTSGGLQDG